MPHFSPGPFLLVIGILAWIAAAALCSLAYKRDPRGKTALTEALRLLVVSLLVLLFWQPGWRSLPSPGKPKLAILTDQSPSMKTADAELPGFLSPNRETVSRSESVERFLASPAGKSLAPPEETLFLPFPDNDLETTISSLLENEPRLRAIVLFSGGFPDDKQPLVTAAQRLLLRGIPLFAIPLGNESARVDVLEETARISGGRLVSPDELPRLAGEIRTLPPPVATSVPLFSHPAAIALPLLLLAAFWTIRKLTGSF